MLTLVVSVLPKSRISDLSEQRHGVGNHLAFGRRTTAQQMDWLYSTEIPAFMNRFTRWRLFYAEL
ncbi:MAG: hypothetical protein ACLUI3_07225 [Christensenellales bacterium]